MTPGLAGLDLGDISALIGFGWLMVPGGFFGGWLYLRMRTFSDNLF
jgi:hypothetical protein